MRSHHCNANFHFQKTLLLDKPLSIEVPNDVPRNGVSKSYFSYSYFFSTLSLVMFATPINRCSVETLSFIDHFSLMRTQTIELQYRRLVNAIHIHMELLS